LGNAVCKTFTVSKDEMQRREAEWQRTQDNARSHLAVGKKRARRIGQP
jgi:hypothetical protein